MLEHCVEQSNAYFAKHDVMNKIRAGRLPGFPASPAHGAQQKNAGLGAFLSAPRSSWQSSLLLLLLVHYPLLRMNFPIGIEDFRFAMTWLVCTGAAPENPGEKLQKGNYDVGGA